MTLPGKLMRLCGRNYLISSQKSRFCTAISRISSRFEPVTLSQRIYNEGHEASANPRLVMFHGLYGNKNNWNSLAKRLSKQLNTTVICADLRNHGESPWTNDMSYEHMAADIELVAQDHSIDLLGHSLGGKAVAAFALMRPDLVNKLVIEDVTPRAYGYGKLLQRSSIPEFLDAMLNVDWEIHNQQYSTLPMARRYADNCIKDVVQDPIVRSFLLTNVKEKSDKSGAAWMLNLHSIKASIKSLWAFPEFSPDVKFHRPTLFMKGTFSEYIRPEKDMPKSILPLFPQAELVQIEAGHWVHAENPVAFIHELVKFIAK